MIFARFHHIYTHRFESAYADENTLNQAKREWALSLADTSPMLIEHALERCKKEHAWPPTIAEFLKLAQPDPESIGLPATNAAYMEAARKSNAPDEHQWSHLCVQLAALNTGYFVLRSEPEARSRPVFTKAYLALIKRLLAGETLAMPAHKDYLPEPDNSAELKLVEQLTTKGMSLASAQNAAYYLTKPPGSAVRGRYRKQALALLASQSLVVDLPD